MSSLPKERKLTKAPLREQIGKTLARRKMNLPNRIIKREREQEENEKFEREQRRWKAASETAEEERVRQIWEKYWYGKARKDAEAARREEWLREEVQARKDQIERQRTERREAEAEKTREAAKKFTFARGTGIFQRDEKKRREKLRRKLTQEMMTSAGMDAGCHPADFEAAYCAPELM